MLIAIPEFIDADETRCYNPISVEKHPHRRPAQALLRIRREVNDRRGQPIDVAPVRELLERIVRRWNPHQVWLFGSRARGEASAESDWDFLVIVPDDVTPEDLHPMEIYRTKTGTRLPSDVVPFTQSEFEDDRTTTNTLPYEVSVAGVLLYER